MIQKKSYLIPNNKINIWWVSVIHLFIGFKKKIAKNYSYLKVSIKITKLNTLIKKKSKINGLLTLTKKEFLKIDGSLLKFKFNSILLLKKKLLPYGKEIFNPSLFNIKRRKLLIYFSFYI